MAVDMVLLRRSFIASLPVMTGYGTMGFAAGVLLALNGGVSMPALWGGLTSAAFVSGPLQFLLVDWVKAGTAYLDVAVLVVCMNVRYSLYGLSLLDRYQVAPWPARLYMIGTITDETYALQVECPYPAGRDGTWYCLLLAMFDHAYWIVGVVAGALAGAALPFEAKGIDFAMTALFLVILTDQCRERQNRIPAMIGAFSAVAACLVFGVSKMFIPAMTLIVVTFLLTRRWLDADPEGRADE
ncbi:MAG: AzlC family ABC transporter permease [Kiritimatiellae bacterium]|nr:AzlC family ABC transporter permease [Kiritimatiellia bacterium]